MNTSQEILIGETVAFIVPDRNVLILHRVIEKYQNHAGEVSLCFVNPLSPLAFT